MISEAFSIVLCTGGCSLTVRRSSSCNRLGLPGIDLRLGPIVKLVSFVGCSIRFPQHTCCMACKRLSWPCSSGCGEALPSYGLLWQWDPPLGVCRRRKRSMRARRARSGRCARPKVVSRLPLFPVPSERGETHEHTGQSRASCNPPIVFALTAIVISDVLGRSCRVSFGGHTRQLIRPVLVVLVAELVGANESAGLRVACSSISTHKIPTCLPCASYRYTIVESRRSVVILKAARNRTGQDIPEVGASIPAIERVSRVLIARTVAHLP